MVWSMLAKMSAAAVKYTDLPKADSEIHLLRVPRRFA